MPVVLECLICKSHRSQLQIMQHVRKNSFEPINTSPKSESAGCGKALWDPLMARGQELYYKGQPPTGYVHLVFNGPPRSGNSLLAHVYDHDHITQVPQVWKI